MQQQNSVRRLDIENNMRQAVATGIDEFVVFYQPVVDINTEECASCEALVRWDSKSLGFMGPGDFIPLAEYLGLITSIGDYVLRKPADSADTGMNMVCRISISMLICRLSSFFRKI